MKRVAINISLPDDTFKKNVKNVSALLQTTPSKEFVKLYHRLFRKLPRSE